MTQSLLELLVMLAMLEKDHSSLGFSPGHQFDPLSRKFPQATISEAVFWSPRATTTEPTYNEKPTYCN